MAQLRHEAAMWRPTKQLARSSLASPPYLRLLLQAFSDPKHAINLTAVPPSRGFQPKAAAEGTRDPPIHVQTIATYSPARGLCTLIFKARLKREPKAGQASSCL
jgi:hypothetical protein